MRICGEENNWADLLTRWTAPLTIRRLVAITPLCTTFKDFERPSLSTLEASQSSTATTRPIHLLKHNDVWRNANSNAIWIRDDENALQLRFAVNAHTRAVGHWGFNATKNSLFLTSSDQPFRRMLASSSSHAFIEYQPERERLSLACLVLRCTEHRLLTLFNLIILRLGSVHLSNSTYYLPETTAVDIVGFILPGAH